MSESDDEPIDPEQEYRRLLRFLTREGPRFGLVHAIARDGTVADELRNRAIVELAGDGIRAATLELGSRDEHHDLVQKMVDAIGTGEARVDALFVAGLEFLLLDSAGRPRHAPSISNLNQRRDSLPRLLDARIVFWVPERAYEVYAVELRDTREVMLSTFRFPQTIARPVEPRRTSELPGWFTVFDEDTRARLREQAGVHERLYAGASGIAAAEFAANVARIRLSIGDVEQALPWLERAATQFEQLGRADEAIEAIRRAIAAELFRGNHANVERWVERGLAVAQASGDNRGYCKIARLHAESLMERGELDGALSILRELEQRCRIAGLDRDRAKVMSLIADVMSLRGLHDEALAILHDLMITYDTLGDASSHAATLGRIADVYQARGDLDEALRIHQQERLPVFERLGDMRARAVTLGQIADIFQARGELDEALRIHQEERLPVYERLGDMRGRAVTLGQVADILKARGELDEALRIRQNEELPVYDRLGDARAHAVALSNDDENLPAYQRYQAGQLFIVRWRRPNVDAAQKLAEEVLRRREQVGQPLLMGVIIGPDCAVPDAAAREALLRGHDQVYDACSSIQMVFLGGTLRHALMRSVVSGMMIRTGEEGRAIGVERSVAGFATTVEKLLGIDPHTLLDNLAAAGLLDAA